MARPVSITKDKILVAALDVVRKGGASALTARSLSSALGCGVNPIFSAYGSMEGVLEAVRTQARNMFKERVGAGFDLNPPFKGFGMALLWSITPSKMPTLGRIVKVTLEVMVLLSMALSMPAAIPAL